MVTAHEPRGIHRRISFTVTDALKERFAAKVDKNGPVPQHDPSLGPCWLWTGAMRNSYGAIKHEGSVLSTHIVAYAITNGPVPEGLLVTHKCDRRECCNPGHLRAGTCSDNSREAWDRREVNATRGTKHPCAKFTDAEVNLYRAYKVARNLGYRKAAAKFGIAEGGLKHILGNTGWKHLPWPTLEEAELLIAGHEVHS
jgi:hypothetical protein